MDTLKDLYIDQLQDLYSADKQALSVSKDLAKAAKNDELKSALERNVVGISKGMEQIKGLIQDHGADPKGEHCKGMEGLVTEARAHALEADISDDDVRDASIIAQTQRMTHYALAGYGVVRAFAQRQGLKADMDVLQECLDETYGGDRELTRIAETEVNAAAA
jgi:ferritin-like metal-binding protein YciE